LYTCILHISAVKAIIFQVPSSIAPCGRYRYRNKSIDRRDAFACVCWDQLQTIGRHRRRRSSP